MKKFYSVVAATAILASTSYAADGVNYHIHDLLRYEGVTQDNAAEDATGLINRFEAGTGYEKNGFGVYGEIINVSAVIDDYKDTAGNGNQFSVIKDPAQTRLTQAKLYYKSKELDATVGRDMYTLDDHRFVGHVKWRMMPQTFDVAALNYKGIEGLQAKVAYVFGRHTVGYYDNLLGTEVDGVEQANTKTNSILANLNYKVNDDLKVRLYNYMISSTHDTLGGAIIGKVAGLNYHAEVAFQSTASLKTESTDTITEFDTLMYSNFVLSKKVGGVKLIAQHETLGGDGTKGFTTPWATLHKFNGWADVYLGGTPVDGLAQATLGAVYKDKELGLFKAFYHMYSDSDYGKAQGSEINLLHVKPLPKLGLKTLLKAAFYTAADATENPSGVDTTKLWASVQYDFKSK
jgi:hypothetical protein